MSTTVQKLSDAWNKLRNAALGRGTQLPAGMSSELADEVGQTYEQWREWLEEQGALGEMQREITLLGEGREWADRYEQLAAEVTRATGVVLPMAPSSPLEQVAEQVSVKLAPAALALFVGVGVVLTAKALSGMGARRPAR